MARPQLDEQERRARTVGVRVTGGRGDRAAGASAGGAALDGGLPAPPGAGAAGADVRQSCGWGRRSYGS